MAEILTESFCERCGTRYTFETAPARGRSLSALGTFGRGLKHFVVMPDASLDEAMAVARSETEQRQSTAQLDAFHRTFNFCLSCRQYTCADCWNAVEGRCLSCAPMPEVEVPPAPEATSEAVHDAAPVAWPATEPAPVHVEPTAVGPVGETFGDELAETAGAADNEATVADAAEDVEAVAVAPALAEPIAEPATEAPVAAEAAVDKAEAAVEADAAVEAEAEADDAAVMAEPPAPVAEAPAGAVAAATDAPAASPFPGFLPGRSLDEEIAAYELRIAALASMPPEPLTRPAEPPAAPPEPPVRRPEAPQPGAPRLASAARPTLGPPAQRATRIVAEARAGREPAGVPPAATRPAVPTPAVPMAAGIASPGTCGTCGLSLSASARFCRRCGTRQGV